MDAESQALGLQHAAEMVQAMRNWTGDDHRLVLRVGEQFLHVGRHAQVLPIKTEFVARRRAGISDDLVPAARAQCLSHAPAVRVIAENCKAHSLFRRS